MSSFFRYLHDRRQSGGSVAVVGDDSLQEHDEREHGGHFDPETMTCKLRDEMGAETLDPEVGEENAEAPIPANAGRDARGRPCGIGHIYTGSAADYDRPSLVHVGTGEGSQVYGWGLYGSSVRGVAEGYAKSVASNFANRNKTFFKGKSLEDEYNNDDDGDDIYDFYCQYPHIYPMEIVHNAHGVENGIKQLERKVREQPTSKFLQDALKFLLENKNDFSFIPATRPTVYSQTFFTNRAPGDESHLLSWYEPVSEDQKKWIIEGLTNPSVAHQLDSYVEWRSANIRKAKSGEEVYQIIKGCFGCPKAASEFLARAGIDGIKYPVGSYGGKGVKDGDKAGWNYVSFRDDNICVNGKIVDGKEMPVSMDEALRSMRRRMRSTEDMLSEFLDQMSKSQS